jgi:aarF domain-containing kinase
MLNSIGISMSHMDDKVGAPKSQPYLCSRKVLIMSLVVGENCDTAFGPASKYKSGKDKQRRSTEFCSTLFSSYGYQLFCIGAFHSDPHPGNIFVTKNGACAMLDFGQIKVLRDETQLLFARMIIALNLNSNESVKLMRQIGLKIERSSAEIEKLVAYLLFDTRMDIPEAKLSPLALELPPELRVVSLSKIGADIFMIIRIITMFRGILTAQGVDVHARSIWYPFAITVLYRNGEYARQNLDLNAMQNPKSLREQLQELSNWMQLRNLPFNRDALTPFAIAGIFNISDLHTQISSGKDELVNKVFRNFPEADKKRCMEFLQLH